MSSDLKQWVEDWSETFGTEYSVEDLQQWTGKKIELFKPDDEDSYEFEIVGWTQTVVTDGENTATQLSIVTANGMMIQLRSGVSVKVVE